MMSLVAGRNTVIETDLPSKQMIHEHGVTPDIRVTLTPAQDQDVLLLRRMKELPVAKQQLLKGMRDIQLDRAIDVLTGLSTFTSNQHEAGKSSAQAH